MDISINNIPENEVAEKATDTVAKYFLEQYPSEQIFFVRTEERFEYAFFTEKSIKDGRLLNLVYNRNDEVPSITIVKKQLKTDAIKSRKVYTDMGTLDTIQLPKGLNVDQFQRLMDLQPAGVEKGINLWFRPKGIKVEKVAEGLYSFQGRLSTGNMVAIDGINYEVRRYDENIFLGLKREGSNDIYTLQGKPITIPTEGLSDDFVRTIFGKETIVRFKELGGPEL